ncbi:MAG TPA: response regulator transcription factor [Candidatus Paceibacterota bacterium]|nr:response regulator transcription factor [Candidatus Paceibacterota bacterium]
MTPESGTPNKLTGVITIAIVEDNAPMRETLMQLIQETPELKCIGVCDTAAKALRQIPKLAPDVVIMDIRLPDRSGIECTARLKPLLPETQIMIYTVNEDNDQIFEALKAGASGYLLKSATPTDIREALVDIRLGGSPMSSEIARKVVQSFRQPEVAKNPDLAHLTRREEEILALLAQGYVAKEIAQKLFLSYATVRTHLHHIYEKLHVSSKTEAVVKYLK